MNVVTAVIKGRHSVRKFKSDPVDELFIHDAIECAVHAPTAMNLQPWLIGVIRTKDLLEKIRRSHGPRKIHCRRCSVFCCFWRAQCQILSGRLLRRHREPDPRTAGLWGGFLLGCRSKKEYADAVRKLLNVPEKYTLVALVPAGLPQDISLTSKKDTKKVIFFDRFVQA